MYVELAKQLQVKIGRFSMPGGQVLYFARNKKGRLLNDGQSMTEKELKKLLEERARSTDCQAVSRINVAIRGAEMAESRHRH